MISPTYIGCNLFAQVRWRKNVRHPATESCVRTESYIKRLSPQETELNRFCGHHRKTPALLSGVHRPPAAFNARIFALINVLWSGFNSAPF